jgi:hypothetical protein
MVPPPPPRARPVRRPQSTAVAVLALALAAMLTLWVVGGYLLYTNAPDNFGEPPQTTASPSPS